VFVNFRSDEGDIRFDEVQLGDLGSCVRVDSSWATSGTLVGAPMWTAPEILMEIPWNTAADMWSFGAMETLPLPCIQFLPSNPSAHQLDLRRRLQHLPPQGQFHHSRSRRLSARSVQAAIAVLRSVSRELRTDCVSRDYQRDFADYGDGAYGSAYTVRLGV
jgi:serine/threonine protein kinase